MAITRVQTAIAVHSVAATSQTVTFNAAPSVADGKFHYIMMGIATNQQNASVDPTADYSWSQFSELAGATATFCHFLWARVFGNPASATITIRLGASGQAAVVAVEYKSDAPLRLDRQAIATTVTATTVSSGTTSTTSAANELLLATLTHRTTSAGVTVTPPGPLVIGVPYRITTFVAGDNFTNVGASANASGVAFVATGTTPTTWTNGSTVTNVIGTFTTPTNSFTEVVVGGITTYLNTSGADRELDLAEQFVTSTGTYSTASNVTGSNVVAGSIITFQEVVATGFAPTSRIHGQ